MAPPVIQPAVCAALAVYSCAPGTGSPMDLCAVAGVSTFDTSTGDWTFSTTDFETYLAGTYPFDITVAIGTAPTATATVSFK